MVVASRSEKVVKYCWLYELILMNGIHWATRVWRKSVEFDLERFRLWNILLTSCLTLLKTFLFNDEPLRIFNLLRKKLGDIFSIDIVKSWICKIFPIEKPSTDLSSGSIPVQCFLFLYLVHVLSTFCNTSGCLQKLKNSKDFRHIKIEEKLKRNFSRKIYQSNDLKASFVTPPNNSDESTMSQRCKVACQTNI